MSTLRNSSWTIQNMSLHMGGLKIPLQTPVSTTCRFHCWNDQRSFICINHLEHSAERRQGLLRPGPICLSQLHGQCTVLLFLQEVRWSEYFWSGLEQCYFGGRENKLKRQLVMWRYELRREDNCAQVSAPFPQRHEKVPTQSDSLILCIFFLGISYLY